LNKSRSKLDQVQAISIHVSIQQPTWLQNQPIAHFLFLFKNQFYSMKFICSLIYSSRRHFGHLQQTDPPVRASFFFSLMHLQHSSHMLYCVMNPASTAACSSRDPPLHTLYAFLILAAISLFGRTDISIKPWGLQAQILIS
jgi:hypothetical protein